METAMKHLIAAKVALQRDIDGYDERSSNEYSDMLDAMSAINDGINILDLWRVE